MSRLPVIAVGPLLALSLLLFPLSRSTGAAGTTPPLSALITLDAVRVMPPNVQDGQPFTMTARVINQGSGSLDHLQYFPSVIADPTHPKDHPRIQILKRSPADLLLRPGQEANIAVTFRVTTPGTRRYGLLLARTDQLGDVIFSADPQPRSVSPATTIFRLRQAARVSFVPVLLLVMLALVSYRSHWFRRRLVSQIAPAITARLVVELAIAVLLVATSLNLSHVFEWASKAGLLPASSVGWAIYLFIPVRVLVPLAVSFYLSRGIMPGFVVLSLFLTGYVGTNASLWGQVPDRVFIQLSLPAALLWLTCVSLRQIRTIRVAAASSVVALLYYGTLSLPLWRVYANVVLFRR